MAEKRLISLDEAIAKVKDDGILGEGYSDDERIDDVCDILESCEIVDAVEVVRCRDCKHWMKDVPVCTDTIGRCRFANYMVGGNAYCVYGERKDGDGNG